MASSSGGLVAIVVLAIAGAGSAFTPQPLRPLGPEVAAFVRDAVADRFSAGDIPDLTLIENRQHVLVLKEMRVARMLLTPDALPRLPKTTFELVSLEAAESRASRTGREVPCLAIDEPHIDGAVGTLSLGVDIALPRGADTIKLCCCAGRAEFQRTPERWVFRRWGRTTCS